MLFTTSQTLVAISNPIATPITLFFNIKSINSCTIFVCIEYKCLKYVFILSYYKMKQKTHNLIFVWDEFLFIALFFFIDVLTKWLVFGSQYGIVDSVLNRAGSRWLSIPLTLILVFSLFAIVGCIIAYEKKLIPYWSFILLLAWALWNMFDRLLYGWVRDWINIWIIPVFNIADVLITIWLGIFIYYEMKQELWKH